MIFWLPQEARLVGRLLIDRSYANTNSRTSREQHTRSKEKRKICFGENLLRYFVGDELFNSKVAGDHRYPRQPIYVRLNLFIVFFKYYLDKRLTVIRPPKNNVKCKEDLSGLYTATCPIQYKVKSGDAPNNAIKVNQHRKSFTFWSHLDVNSEGRSEEPGHSNI